MTPDKEQAETIGPGRQKLRALNALVEREARYADAMRDAYRAHLSPDFPPTDGWANLSRAVMAVADAEIDAQVEAAVSAVRAEVEAAEAVRRHVVRRERALREGLEALADKWKSDVVPDGAGDALRSHIEALRAAGVDLRALLASSPAEAAHVHQFLPSVADVPYRTCSCGASEPAAPAPVSSVEGVDPESADWREYVDWVRSGRPAPVVTPSAEGSGQ